MKKKIITSVVIAALVSSFGCTTTSLNSANGSMTTKPSFNYLIEGGENWGVVQAFISKGQTHVQFLDIARASPTFLDKDGVEIEYKPIGMYAVLSQTPLEFYIDSPYGRAHVVDGSLKKAILDLQRDKTHPALNSTTDNDKLDKQLESIVEEKNAIVKELNEHQTALLLAKRQLEELQSTAVLLGDSDGSKFFGNAHSVVHRVYFADYSTEVIPSILNSETDAVIKASNAAHKIYVRGFTDSNSMTEVAKDLALNRSLNTKNYLVSLGVDPKKIRVFYRSSGDFLVPNVDGSRQFNRRAEITYFFGSKK